MKNEKFQIIIVKKWKFKFNLGNVFMHGQDYRLEILSNLFIRYMCVHFVHVRMQREKNSFVCLIPFPNIFFL